MEKDTSKDWVQAEAVLVTLEQFINIPHFYFYMGLKFFCSDMKHKAWTLNRTLVYVTGTKTESGTVSHSSLP